MSDPSLGGCCLDPSPGAPEGLPAAGDPTLSVRFFHGMLLGADDLDLQACAERGAREWHQALLHGDGIVTGLRVETRPPPAPAAAWCMDITAGLAFDCHGRPVFLAGLLRCDLAAVLDDVLPGWRSIGLAPPAAPVEGRVRLCVGLAPLHEACASGLGAPPDCDGRLVESCAEGGGEQFDRRRAGAATRVAVVPDGDVPAPAPAGCEPVCRPDAWLRAHWRGFGEQGLAPDCAPRGPDLGEGVVVLGCIDIRVLDGVILAADVSRAGRAPDLLPARLVQDAVRALVTRDATLLDACRGGERDDVVDAVAAAIRRDADERTALGDRNALLEARLMDALGRIGVLESRLADALTRIEVLETA
jgi:hypothetical protein